jgi:uncharacterized protein with HEPN domain
MRRSAPVLLEDAVAAGESIAGIVADATPERYLATRMVRSAVERELLILGEALNALDTLCDDSRQRVTDIGRVVGLRNRLAHGYHSIDDAMIWAIACDDVPRLLAELRAWLTDLT